MFRGKIRPAPVSGTRLNGLGPSTAWLAFACLVLALLPSFSRAQTNQAVNPGPLPATSPPAHEYRVTEFRFQGNTVFGAGALAAEVASYTRRKVTLLDLEMARIAVTRYYVDRGYHNSGAVIESLPNTQGIVDVRIIEGTLTQVNVRSNRWVRAGFYRARLPGPDKPLNLTNDLIQPLKLWRAIYPVDQVNAELRPGPLPGQAILDLQVREPSPYHIGLQYANDKPPATGAEQLTALLRVDSLTRNADQLTLDYGIARGRTPFLRDVNALGTGELAASYSLPLTTKDTTLGLQYSRSAAAVVEAAFAQLGITSNSEVFGVSLMQPVFRSPSREFSLSLSADHKQNQSYLLGMPYSFSRGAIDGKSTVSALRLSTSYVDRSPKHVLAARFTASVGMDVLDATHDTTGPDGQFFSLLSQIKYVRRLWEIGDTPVELVFRVTGQYSPDPLMSLEQISLGGYNTVRGYRENTLIRDLGVIGAVELGIPVWRSAEGQAFLQLVPFVTAGAGWDNVTRTSHPRDISSAGIGLNAGLTRHVQASLFWGHPFRQIDYLDADLQDVGVQFSITIWAF